VLLILFSKGEDKRPKKRRAQKEVRGAERAGPVCGKGGIRINQKLTTSAKRNVEKKEVD